MHQKNATTSDAFPFLSLSDLDTEKLPFPESTETFPIQLPDEYQFLHETAVIEFHGTFFAAWYNNREKELQGETVIRARRSADGGKSWSDAELIAKDPEGRLMYCPPVFGVCDDQLYLLANTMVSADHMHSLELYSFDENDQRFHFRWSRAIPFKLNTNAVHLPDGRLLLPGRIAEPDGFPSTPAVLIADSGKIDGEWRLVKIQEGNLLPDGSRLVHPELSAIVMDHSIYMFCRNDERLIPLLYRSDDLGEHWSAPFRHNLPFVNSKIYSGTLSDGRNYVIGNILCHARDSSWNRGHLAIFFSDPRTMRFNQGFFLRDGEDRKLHLYPQWSYPSAYEANGKLHVVYSMVAQKENQSIRGAMMSIVDLNSGPAAAH